MFENARRSWVGITVCSLVVHSLCGCAAIGPGGGAGGSGQDDNTPTNQDPNSETPSTDPETGPGDGASGGGQEDTPTNQEVNSETRSIDPEVDHFKGDLSAPNVIIEYGNFLCHHCGEFFAENLPDLLALVDAGRAVYVYRHFVSSDSAVLMAQAAECAAAQDEDAFFPYHDRLFTAEGVPSMDTLGQYALELDLDLELFDECLANNEETADKIARDRQAIVALGGVGTPTFLVNGQMLVGNQPVEAFEALFVDRPNKKRGHSTFSGPARKQ